MPAVTLSVKNQIATVIKRFKFEELESAVLPIFPEFSWKDIKSKLVQNHESFTTLRAVKIIQDEINKAKISDKNLLNRLSQLETIDVSRHSHKKCWYSLEFKGKDPPIHVTTEDLEIKIKDNFHGHGMDIDVTAVRYKGLIFLSIKEKPKNKRKKTIVSVFLSLVIKQKFFFTSKKTISNHTILAVAEAMGFSSFKHIKLMGRNIRSLIQLLTARKKAEADGTLIKSPMKFKKSSPIKTPLGLDFTQNNQRKEFADKCFGLDPPSFEYLSIKCKDQKWKNSEMQEELPDVPIFTRIEFRSSNIPNYLKNLVTEKILETPLPIYAANILSVGRNDITIERNERYRR